MKIKVNLSEKLEFSFVPSLVRAMSKHEREEWTRENGEAFIVLEGVNFGFMQSFREHQIALSKLLEKNEGKGMSEIVEANLEQLKFAESIWRENVVGFRGLFDESGTPVTKEQVERDVVLKDEVIKSLANEISQMGKTIISKEPEKK